MSDEAQVVAILFAVGIAIVAVVGGWYMLRPDPGYGEPKKRKRKSSGLKLAKKRPDPRLSSLTQLVKAGDWAGASALVEGEQGQERTWLVDTWVERQNLTKKHRERVNAWLQAEPESAAPHLIRGATRIQWAWQARGGGVASTVTEEGFRKFFARLKTAESDFTRAVELDPQDPSPWSFLLTIARGRQQGPEQLAACLGQAARLCPWHYSAYSQAIQGKAAKWGGTHLGCFNLARSTSEAPAGNPVHAMVASAHIERWIYCSMNDADPDAEAYFTQGWVQEEIHAAWDRMGQPQGAYAARALNTFAFCFSLMGDHPAVTRAIDGAAPWVTEMPWAYMGPSVRLCESARREAAGRDAEHRDCRDCGANFMGGTDFCAECCGWTRENSESGPQR